jgi:hypothetical protein
MIAIGGLCVGLAISTAAIAADESKGDTSDDRLDVQYVETLVDLLEARLQALQAINQQVPGQVSPQKSQALELKLRAARQVLQRMQQNGKEVDWFSLLLSFAEASYVDARAAWEMTVQLRQLSPNTTSELDVKIAKLSAELAHLNYKRGKRLASGALEDQQNWAMTVFLVEIERLQNGLATVQSRK